jgi:hypothetical protein
MRDLNNSIFGRLTVIKNVGKNKFGQPIWNCKCSCGQEKNILNSSLISGRTKSCGCLQKELYAKRKGNINIKHSMSKSRFYGIYNAIKFRCYNKNSDRYKDWGGRGITVCKEWLDDFINFKNDMYESYLEHVKEFGENQTSIDRVDNNKNYCKENCKWSTCKEQNANQRDYPSQRYFKAISPDGEEIISNNQNKFARDNNLHPGHIGDCLENRFKQHKGWKFILCKKENQ